MKYVLEICDRDGTGIADEEHSLIESDTPLPIPNVGDEVYFPDGAGPTGNQAGVVEVVNRTFTFCPATKREDAYVQIQVFCKESENK